MVHVRKPNSLISVSLRSSRVATRLIVAASFLIGCSHENNRKVLFDHQIEVAEGLLSQGKDEQAYSILEDVSRDNQASGKVALALGDAFLRKSAFFKASHEFERARDLGEPFLSDLGIARVELARNRSQDALAILERLSQEQPNNVDVLNGMGVAYDLVRQHSRALEFYLAALTRDPNHIATNNNLALSLMLSGNSERSIEILGDIARSNRNSVKVRQNLALAYLSSGNETKALEISRLDLPEQTAQTNISIAKAYFQGR